METSTSDLAQQLAAIPVFSDLSPEDVSWLASQMEVADFAPGEVVTAEAMVPTTIAFLHVSHFPEMLKRLPTLGQSWWA